MKFRRVVPISSRYHRKFVKSLKHFFVSGKNPRRSGAVCTGSTIIEPLCHFTFYIVPLYRFNHFYHYMVCHPGEQICVIKCETTNSRSWRVRYGDRRHRGRRENTELQRGAQGDTEDTGDTRETGEQGVQGTQGGTGLTLYSEELWKGAEKSPQIS